MHIHSLDDTIFNVNISILYAIIVDNLAILDEKPILGTLQRHFCEPTKVDENKMMKLVKFHK